MCTQRVFKMHALAHAHAHAICNVVDVTSRTMTPLSELSTLHNEIADVFSVIQVILWTTQILLCYADLLFQCFNVN